MNQFDLLRLAMFSGKGGVGKTTLACGFARRWARRFPDEEILLLSTDPAHSLGDVLQMAIADSAHRVEDLPNLRVRALDAGTLLKSFKAKYGKVLELLVERGSFVQNDDLTPVWDLGFPGLDELMSILEIQRILQDREADRIVVDMAPSGHTLNLFGLMDFLEEFLSALELFQEKHRVISQTFTGRYTADAADDFLQTMGAELAGGRQLLQDADFTGCLVVAIAEPMSLLETERFLAALEPLHIPVGGMVVNRVLGGRCQVSGTRCQVPSVRADGEDDSLPFLDRFGEQQKVVSDLLNLAKQKPVFGVPQQDREPIGAIALDSLMAQVFEIGKPSILYEVAPIPIPEKVLSGLSDFIAAGRRLLIVGGKGGVGKTTVAAAIAWGLAEKYGDRAIRVVSIDPAHSLGDAFGQPLGHLAAQIRPNLTGQEVDAEAVLDQFRSEYLWELAEMMSGETSDGEVTLKVAYAPEAWRKIVTQALPGIDEMLSLITVMDLLESGTQDLIVLDTAPTGHLLRFLEMPAAMSDWLAWIFKLWIKYQDVLGRTDFMARLRTLRQRVVQAQKKLKDPHHTEFIGVVLAESAVIAEAQRLSDALSHMGIAQRYIVHNRFEPKVDQPQMISNFPTQTMVHLPRLPRSVSPLERIAIAATLLF